MPSSSVDAPVAYLIRSGINEFKRLQSSTWTAQEAHVTHAEWRSAFARFGCDLAKVQYKYSVEGQEYRGISVEPFFIGGNPDGPVQVLPPGTATKIRYEPQNPSKSILVERWWITRRGKRA
jgi:hypothetical protein